MQADLDTYGVSVVALSKDTVEEAAIHKSRDGLAMTNRYVGAPRPERRVCPVAGPVIALDHSGAWRYYGMHDP